MVRYSRENSLTIRQNVVTLMSRTEEGGWPRNSRKEWNLQEEEDRCEAPVQVEPGLEKGSSTC